jgi:hypothetical protein
MDFGKEGVFYKYIGVIALASLVIYLVIKTFNFQKNVLEGFESNYKPTGIDELNKNLNEVKDGIKDKLLVNKYRDKYEEALMNIDEVSSLKQVTYLLEHGYDKNNGVNTNVGYNVGLYKKIREGVKDSLEHLDSM